MENFFNSAFLSIILCTLRICHAVQFLQHPQNHIAKVHSMVNFSCAVDALEAGQTIAWYFEGTQISQNQDIVGNSPRNAQVTRQENLFTLIITSVEIIDSRSYHCAVIEEGATEVIQILTSSAAVLTVHYLPSSRNPVCERVAPIKSGKSVELVCHSTKGNPLVTLSWQRSDGRHIDQNDTKFDINENSRTEVTYRLVTNMEDNNVIFTCTSRSTAFPEYMSTCVVNLTVEFSPNITSIDEVYLDQNIQMTCLAVGNPFPTIEWSLIGLTSFVSDGNTLTLNESLDCSTTVQVTCTASNTLGKTSRTVILCDPVTTGTVQISNSEDTTSMTSSITTSSSSISSSSLLLRITVPLLVISVVILVFVAVVISKRRLNFRKASGDNTNISNTESNLCNDKEEELTSNETPGNEVENMRGKESSTDVDIQGIDNCNVNMNGLVQTSSSSFQELYEEAKAESDGQILKAIGVTGQVEQDVDLSDSTKETSMTENEEVIADYCYADPDLQFNREEEENQDGREQDEIVSGIYS